MLPLSPARRWNASYQFNQHPSNKFDNGIRDLSFDKILKVPSQLIMASLRSVYNYKMCRSIKQLRHPEFIPTNDEINAAALQYIRKVSGYRQPSRANQAAFEQAVSEVAQTTRSLIENLQSIAARK